MCVWYLWLLRGRWLSFYVVGGVLIGGKSVDFFVRYGIPFAGEKSTTLNSHEEKL